MTSIKIILLYLFISVASCVNAICQLQPKYVIKYDPLGFLFGEFRIAYEWKLTSFKYLYTSASYFSHEATIDDPIQEEDKVSGFSALWKQFMKSDINKFLYTSASYFYKDDVIAKERLQGPLFRFGIRQYFLTKYAPSGPFIYLGVQYGFIYAEAFAANNARVHTILIHKPGMCIAFGYQHLFGNKRNWAIDFFSGLEYNFLIEQGARPNAREWQNLPSLALHGGLALGFAFRQKHRHF